MSEWAAKRFWSDVSVVAEGSGFAIHLDDRTLMTPAKAALVVPVEALADEIAREWRAIDVKIDPTVMPFTRSANAAIDKVAVQFGDVADMLADYGGSDLLCYRADGPEGLVARQDAGWTPLLEWAADTFGARLETTVGVMPVAQDAEALAALAAPLRAATTFQLTSLHDLVALSGSLVLALAVARERLSPQAAWDLSRLDETWQAEQWGADEDAAATAAIKRAAFLHACQLYQLVTNRPNG